MEITEDIKNFILNSQSRALATFGKDINLIPVSTLKIDNNKIILVNYFMDKTIKNIKENQNVSLTCWSGFEGYQIKSTVEYKEDGEIFNDIKEWVSNVLPERIVKGILILTPKEIFDVSASAGKPEPETN